MAKAKQSYLRRKIRRLESEITAIDEMFYLLEKEGDPRQYAAMLERKRDDMISAAVLQLHTSIEDILNDQLMCHILHVAAHKRMKMMPTPAGKALRIINDKRRKRLGILNTLRNRCSHFWLLKAPVRKGKRPRQKKPPLLLYEGRDLHQVATFEDFLTEYGPLYTKMFVEYLDYLDT